MMAGWGGVEGMVPERRQEHVPYLYSLSYLATQCINNVNRVTKCRFTGKHADHSVHWNTLIKSIETCNSPSPLKHPPVAPSFRILFNETNYINNLHPQTVKNNNNTCKKKTPQKLNGFQQGSLAGRQPSTPPSPPHSFLPFWLCNI